MAIRNIQLPEPDNIEAIEEYDGQAQEIKKREEKTISWAKIALIGWITLLVICVTGWYCWLICTSGDIDRIERMAHAIIVGLVVTICTNIVFKK